MRAAKPRITLVTCMLAVSACAGAGHRTLDPAATSIVYSYVGSSTPPPYRHEYRITAVKGSATIAVGSYGTAGGDAAAEKNATATVDGATWSRLLDDAARLRSGRGNADDGCVGGSTVRVRVSEHDQPVTDTSNYSCGFVEGNGSPALGDLVSTLEALFDMDRLLGS